MSTPTKLTSFLEVQQLLDTFVADNSLTPGLAPHKVFWHTDANGDPMTYQEFTTGYVPGFNQAQYPPNGLTILTVGDAQNSTIIQALSGTGPFSPSGGIGIQMPQPNPPYNGTKPTQTDVIALLSDWINNNCPNNS